MMVTMKMATTITAMREKSTATKRGKGSSKTKKKKITETSILCNCCA